MSESYVGKCEDERRSRNGALDEGKNGSQQKSSTVKSPAAPPKPPPAAPKKD